MLSLSSAAIIEKNKLASDGAWIILLQIDLTDGTTLRVCRNTEDVTWNSETWVAFPFELDDLSENSADEVPQLAVKVSNHTRTIQSYLEAGSGGVGATVTVRVVHSAHLDLTDPELEMSFLCTGCSATSQWATFTLGTSNPFRQRFPKARMLKNVCRWTFKSTECGYSGTATECDKTLSRCRELSNSERYGGFPAAGTGALYVD